MNKAIKIMLLLSAFALTACTQSMEDMLVGRWRLERVIETVYLTPGDHTTVDTLPGYDSQTLEFMADATCIRTDRGDTTFYQWALSDGKTLALWHNEWAEDYYVERLDDSRLVLDDNYSHRDTVTGIVADYTYSFEYKKM